MRKKCAALVSESGLQTQQTNDEQALVLHAQLMDQYAEAFQKLENDTLGRLMAEDDSETLSLEDAQQYYGNQPCATNN
jgi:hypothetical protein